MTALTSTGCARCLLSAGLAAALVVTGSGPATAAAPQPAWSASAASVALTAAALPLEPDPGVPTTTEGSNTGAPDTGAAGVEAAQSGGAGDFLINAYNLIQPYVQWGFELAAWAVSYLPWPIGYLGAQIDILYDTFEPIAQALVYAAAFLLDGQYDLIVPVLTNGVNAAVTYFVQGEIAWVLSFFPPLPPLPSLPVFPIIAAAPAASQAPAAGGAADETAPTAGRTDEPVEAAAGDAAPRSDLRRSAVRAQRAAGARAVATDTAETTPTPAPTPTPAAAEAAPAAESTASASRSAPASAPDKPGQPTAGDAATAAPAKAGAARAARRG